MNAFAAAFGAVLLGWLIADVLGGFVHWVEDRLLSERVPLIGAYIVTPNRLHHRDPLAFTRSDFLDRNLATFVVAGTLSALWAWALGLSLIWASATLGGMVSSQVHYLTHRPRPKHAWLRVLQDVGLIQSAGHHAGRYHPGQQPEQHPGHGRWARGGHGRQLPHGQQPQPQPQQRA